MPLNSVKAMILLFPLLTNLYVTLSSLRVIGQFQAARHVTNNKFPTMIMSLWSQVRSTLQLSPYLTSLQLSVFRIRSVELNQILHVDC